MILRVVEDQEGRLWPVTDLFDKNAQRTDNPEDAETIVIKLGEDNWWSGPAEYIIHTVH